MNTKPLFRGEVLFVWPGGFTPEELKQLQETVAAQGAELWDPEEHSLYADALLVKDAEVLVGCGCAKDWLAYVDTAVVLTAAWVTDSVKTGQKLNGKDYKVDPALTGVVQPLFQGEVLRVCPTGFTEEEAEELRKAVVTYGGELWDSVTHKGRSSTLLVKDASVLVGDEWGESPVGLRASWVTDSIRYAYKGLQVWYKVERSHS